MIRRFTGIAVLLLSLAMAQLARAQSQSTLDIYFIDVEGGQATLFVTPHHDSLLIDTGWPGRDSRDARRIVAAAKLAGLTKIDDVIITHYHDDHVGGVPQLVAQMPVGTFIDHGPLYERCPTCVSGFNSYTALIAAGKAKRLTVKPGDSLPLRDLEVKVLSANGDVIAQPMPGAGQPNTFCAASEIRPDDTTENSHSVGVSIRFGRFHTTDLGDLTWDKERALMCPVNRIGEDSLLIVSHHGWNQSSSPAYVDAVKPQVAIMDNGATKGGSLPTVITLNAIPGMKAMWQLHRSEEAGPHNVPEDRIANLTGDPAIDKGYYLKVSAKRDGSFTVFNERTGKTVAYPAR
ncbi:Metal-dependent hydrolase, beta-lactamase superfamily II [Bryocella elongata]|uniref:Metal-dependent hydrolase, beta-lactamase superfamily II n=1 Tax=Bryocella elongata TaxID=863522 RepID=A0A1H5Z282_9BACT|nr:MBL fold metallo-hydrolase [Bryocella elongata]SEG30613.1 Metal-dependent hydrolase, beta-lactamase superfamily II [Bryocella elongata]